MSDAKIVLDTCVVSYLMKGGQLAEAYAPHLQGRLLVISFITVGELYYGAENARWGSKKRRELETALRNFVVIPFAQSVIVYPWSHTMPKTSRVSPRWISSRRKKGIHAADEE